MLLLPEGRSAQKQYIVSINLGCLGTELNQDIRVSLMNYQYIKIYLFPPLRYLLLSTFSIPISYLQYNISLLLFIDLPQVLEKQKAAPLKSSNIVSREYPYIELKPGDEVFPPSDTRAISPQASNRTIGRIVQEIQEEAEKYVIYFLRFFVL